MRSSKLRAGFLVLNVLAGTLSVYYGLSALVAYVSITNTGSLPTVGNTTMVYKSEIRGVFVHCATFSFDVDWNLIAQTLAQYRITDVYIEIASYDGGYYGDSPYGDQLSNSIAALHPKGIRVHAAMDVVYENMGADLTVRAIDSNLQPTYWNCPTNPTFRNYVKNVVEDIAAYDIDGFMFDYIRYDTDDMCYCQYCKAKFEGYLGETITSWPGPFAPGGARNSEFMEWRITPITELVRDIRQWTLAIKPNLEFSIAAWTLFQDSPTYWRYWLGQDTADWVAKDYLDLVAPMMYTTTLTGPDSIEDYIESSRKYITGGVEGKVPLVAFITTGIGEVVSPTAFKAVVDKARALGADGWIIWRYGGPGADPSVAPDIRNYLSLIDLPEVFSLENIEVYNNDAQAIISWTTNLPATSKVEYSTSPLFNASFLYNEAVDFHYWDVDPVFGTIVEDNTPVTSHSITLSGLTPGSTYYFRVKSTGSGGTATGKVMTFATGS